MGLHSACFKPGGYKLIPQETDKKVIRFFYLFYDSLVKVNDLLMAMQVLYYCEVD